MNSFFSSMHGKEIDDSDLIHRWKQRISMEPISMIDLICEVKCKTKEIDIQTFFGRVLVTFVIQWAVTSTPEQSQTYKVLTAASDYFFLTQIKGSTQSVKLFVPRDICRKFVEMVIRQKFKKVGTNAASINPLLEVALVQRVLASAKSVGSWLLKLDGQSFTEYLEAISESGFENLVIPLAMLTEKKWKVHNPSVDQANVEPVINDEEVARKSSKSAWIWKQHHRSCSR